MVNYKKKSMRSWIKNNAFNIFTVLGVIFTYVVTLASIPKRVDTLENRVSINSDRLVTLEQSVKINITDHAYIKEKIDDVKRTTDEILRIHLIKPISFLTLDNTNVIQAHK